MSPELRCGWECILVGLQALQQASQLWLIGAMTSPLCHWTCPTFTHYLIQNRELLISMLHLALWEHKNSRPQTIRFISSPQIKSNNSLLSFSERICFTYRNSPRYSVYFQQKSVSKKNHIQINCLLNVQYCLKARSKNNRCWDWKFTLELVASSCPFSSCSVAFGNITQCFSADKVDKIWYDNDKTNKHETPSKAPKQPPTRPCDEKHCLHCVSVV